MIAMYIYNGSTWFNLLKSDTPEIEECTKLVIPTMPEGSGVQFSEQHQNNFWKSRVSSESIRVPRSTRDSQRTTDDARRNAVAIILS